MELEKVELVGVKCLKEKCVYSVEWLNLLANNVCQVKIPSYVCLFSPHVCVS